MSLCLPAIPDQITDCPCFSQDCFRKPMVLFAIISAQLLWPLPVPIFPSSRAGSCLPKSACPESCIPWQGSSSCLSPQAGPPFSMKPCFPRLTICQPTGQPHLLPHVPETSASHPGLHSYCYWDPLYLLLTSVI